jgi:hypothetical protein
MKLSPDRTRLMVGGRAVAACLLGKLPESIPCMTAEEYAATAAAGGPTTEAEPAMQASNNISNGGIEDMEIRNAADLRNAYPDFVAEIENSAREQGATAERQRIQGIENMRNAVADHNMVRNAMYGENPMSVEAFAVSVLTQQAQIGNTMLNNLQADANASGAANVAAAPNGGANPVVDQATEEKAVVDDALAAYKIMYGGAK